MTVPAPHPALDCAASDLASGSKAGTASDVISGSASVSISITGSGSSGIISGSTGSTSGSTGSTSGSTSGSTDGVASTDPDASPIPAELTAEILKLYSCPFESPVIVAEVALLVPSLYAIHVGLSAVAYSPSNLL